MQLNAIRRLDLNPQLANPRDVVVTLHTHTPYHTHREKGALGGAGAQGRRTGTHKGVLLYFARLHT